MSIFSFYVFYGVAGYVKHSWASFQTNEHTHNINLIRYVQLHAVCEEWNLFYVQSIDRELPQLN